MKYSKEFKEEAIKLSDEIGLKLHIVRLAKQTVIFRYVFGYYNTQRINSFNVGVLPPVALRTSKQFSHHAA